MEWIPLPIGVENFEDLREHGYYFVDKTLFIKELLLYPAQEIRQNTEYEHSPIFF